MSNNGSQEATNERIRASALRHAYNIEDKKRMQARVADLIIEAFDLPSAAESDPSRPTSADAILFKQCLKLFQPSDFDDLVVERNVDNRCGYALCPRPNTKITSGGEMAWNRKVGSEFKIVPKADLERWCSRECGESAFFVRAQLGVEPAWVRDTPVENIKLLHEMKETIDQRDSSVTEEDFEMSDRMRALSLERGQLKVKELDQQISILENLKISDRTSPPKLEQLDGDKVEGYNPKRSALPRAVKTREVEYSPDLI